MENTGVESVTYSVIGGMLEKVEGSELEGGKLDGCT